MWPNPQETADLVTFTEEILNGKLYFLCSAGETDRRIKKRIIDHNKRDKNSHILKHSREEAQSHVWDKHFKELGNNYRSALKWKISEALFIK